MMMMINDCVKHLICRRPDLEDDKVEPLSMEMKIKSSQLSTHIPDVVLISRNMYD